MCNCLVYSNLLYCISIWGFRPKTALQALYSMQKKIIHDVAAVSLYELSQQNFKIFRYTCLITLTFMWWLYLLINWFAKRSFNYYIRFDQITPYFVHKILNKHSEQCNNYKRPKIWIEIPLYIREQTHDYFN